MYDELIWSTFDVDMRFSGWKNTSTTRANVEVLFQYDTHMMICYDKICIAFLELTWYITSSDFPDYENKGYQSQP